MATILFIIILSILVIIHELGHYVAAKWAKIVVDEFGIGYPPKAVRLFRWRGTDFTVNWIPFGGFVRMRGEDELVAPDTTKETQKESQSGQFYSATTWQKLVVILAGVTVNFVFGILAFAVVFSIQGIPEYIENPRIGMVAEGSPAAQSGIPENVEILGFKSADSDSLRTTSTVPSVIEAIAELQGQTVTLVTTGNCEQLTCDSTQQEFSVYLRTENETPEGQGSMGIAFSQLVYAFYPAYEMPFRSIWYGLQQAGYLGVQIVAAFGNIFVELFTNGGFPEDIAGPVGIVHQASSLGLFSEGVLAILSFAGMLSINLAVMNLLPILPLDGGRAVFILLQSFFSSRKIIEKIEYGLSYVGYVFLLGLIVAVTVKDIWQLFT